MRMLLGIALLFCPLASDAQVHLALVSSFPLPSEQFKEPFAISVSQAEDVFITDTGNHRVFKFSREGVLLKQIGGFGWNNEEFDTPSDIDARDHLNVYVADTNNKIIKRFNRELTFLATLGKRDIASPDESGLEIGFPAGVAVSPQGDLFLTDGENNQIKQIDKFGKRKSTFGDYQQGEGYLDQPGKIAVSSNEVFVIDGGAAVVRVFDYFGNYLTTLGENTLKKPVGLSISKKLVFVVDAKLKKIIVFDRKGVKIPLLIDNELERPVDISILFEKAFVLSRNRVDIYEIKAIQP